ncbi:dynamin family protein, partial [Aliarcobacter butzleri]
MSLVNDYFLLYHGITFEQNLDTEEIDTILNEDTFTIFALILSATRKNCDKYLPLTSFKTLCQQINVKSPSNITELNHLQHNIVDTISRNKTKNNIIILHSAFEYLKNENILNSEHYNKLLSLFDLKELNITEEQNHISVQKIDDEHKSSFKDLKHNLENIINELKTDLTNKEILGELENTHNYLNNQKFSIGITGVMNAGKSTMLNALMGREILGSAVVPETANLTIVKHNPTDNAKVYYWNEQEWDRIKKSASQLESMKDFVEETNRIFGD